MAKNILIVDDDPIVRELMRSVLEPLYTIWEEISGIHTLNVLQDNIIDLVFLDVFMDDQEGIETLQQIRLNYPQLPVIMISSDLQYLKASTILGANDYLQKPIELDALMTLTEKYLTS